MIETEDRSGTSALWRTVDAALQKGNVQEAILPLHQLWRLGEPHALAMLGLIYENLDEKIKGAQSIALGKYRRAIFESDDGLANYGLARAYYNGVGAHQDSEKAAKHMRKAADAGVGEAALYFANFLVGGIGVNKDEHLAMSYYEIAAQQGFLAAASDLAKLEMRHGRFAVGLFRLTIGSIRAFFVALRNPGDPRLLLLNKERERAK